MSHESRYRKSQSLAHHSAKYDAWVAAELTAPERRNYQFINGQYPLYASHGTGAYIFDVDGNRYIDYILGYGTVILGHGHHAVTLAVQEELGRGHCLSPLWKPQQAELCELICSVIPNAEQAFLMKTGSDATTAAVRLARIFTGRQRVLRWGYNGWHDWSTPRPEGVPPSTLELVHEFPYNDLAAIQRLFDRYGAEIACVFMMPFELDSPMQGYLEAVGALAHDYGALFILDEMRSGFRMALGGAQEFFHVDADLVTLSKAMANGHAISCITGRADILGCLARTKITATYFANSEAMAAALSCIRTLQSEASIDRVWAMGQRLKDGLIQVMADHGDIASVCGYAPCPFVAFDRLEPDHGERAKEIFFANTAANGLLLHPSHHWYVSAAHSAADIDQTIDICDTAARAVVREL